MDFYLDRVSRFRAEYIILLTIFFAIPFDYVFDIILRPSGRLPIYDLLLVIAYLGRLGSIFAAFYIIKFLYSGLNRLIDNMWLSLGSRDELKSIFTYLRDGTKFLNNPHHHILSALAANILYLFILYFYIFPVLGWQPFHVVSNAMWVGVLGIGFYVAINSLRFIHMTLKTIREYNLIDLYNADNVGGLSLISRFTVHALILLSIGEVLWFSSLIYSVKVYFISVILAFGFILSLTLLIYVVYGLHSILVDVKSRLLGDHLSNIKSSFEAIYDESVGLESKIDLLVGLVRDFIFIQQLNSLKTWPI